MANAKRKKLKHPNKHKTRLNMICYRKLKNCLLPKTIYMITGQK